MNGGRRDDRLSMTLQDHLDRLEPFIGNDETRIDGYATDTEIGVLTDRQLITLLQSVALCNDRRRPDIVTQLDEMLREPDSEPFHVLLAILDALIAIAETRPESRSRMDTWHRGLTDHEEPAIQVKANQLNSLLESS